MTHKNIYLSLGSNEGDRLQMLQNACDALSNFCKIIKISSVYESEPWGFSSELFLNIMVKVESELPATTFLQMTQAIEIKLGRSEKNTVDYAQRTIDIDIICFGNLIFYSSSLCIPHLHFSKRNFVLHPFSEIANKYIPADQKFTVQQLKMKSTDKAIPSIIEEYKIHF
jgi:deoxyguanosine kinase